MCKEGIFKENLLYFHHLSYRAVCWKALLCSWLQGVSFIFIQNLFVLHKYFVLPLLLFKKKQKPSKKCQASRLKSLKAFNTGATARIFYTDYGTHKCLAWLTFLRSCFHFTAPAYIMADRNTAEYLCSCSPIHQKIMNKPKFVFPGMKSPCSSSRIEVVVADQVITGPCIRLIEDCGSGLTLQQF